MPDEYGRIYQVRCWSLDVSTWTIEEKDVFNKCSSNRTPFQKGCYDNVTIIASDNTMKKIINNQIDIQMGEILGVCRVTGPAHCKQDLHRILMDLNKVV